MYMEQKIDWLNNEFKDLSSSKKKINEIVDEYGVIDKKLKMIYLYVTFGCNQKCQYCWINNNTTSYNKEMTVEMVDAIIKEALPLGLEHIKITGGEPFANNNLIEIINRILSFNIDIDLETNATMLNEEWLLQIDKLKNVYFKISLDSVNMSEHNTLANIDDDVFQKTISNIFLLKKYSVNFDIVTVMNKINMHSLRETVKFVERLGAKNHRIILSIQPIGHGKEAKEIQLSLNETIQLINEIYLLKKDYKSLAVGTLHSTLPPAFMPLESIQFRACNWGVNLCGIMPNGDVSICAPAFDSMEIVAGNIYRQDLSIIWNDSALFKSLAEVDELEGICGKCLYVKMCRGMCRIFAKAEYGRITSPYPFCQKMYERGLFPAYVLNE